MTRKDKIKELEALLEAVCPKYEDDCTKCPHSKECDQYAKMIREIRNNI